jgi:hypothetical protein
MPPLAISPQEHARRALQRLDERGGAETLPYVLKSSDVIPLMGRTWFQAALHLDGLPGIQVVRYGAWRCDRGVFIHWLQELSHASTSNQPFDPPQMAVAGRYAARRSPPL